MRAVALLISLLLVSPTVGALVPPLFPKPPAPDDCESGRDVGGEPGTAHRLASGDACAGTFTFDNDVDAYRFEMDAGQWAIVTTDDDWDRYGMSACPFGPGREERGCYSVDYQHIQDDFVAPESAEYGLQLSGGGAGYRYNVSVEVFGETDDDPHDDCGLGNGANDWMEAKHLVVPIDCTGILRGMDAWDMYSFDARRGQDVAIHLDVLDGVDHEVCVYAPDWWSSGRRCSTLPAGEDESIVFDDAAESGTWYLVVYRYDGDGAYGLEIDVAGAPGNEDPRPSLSCPEVVEVGTPMTCSFTAADDSPGLAYRIYWDGVPAERVPEEGFAAPGRTFTATHVFTQVDVIRVSVRAEDDGGRVAWATIYAYVRPPKEPHADCASATDAGDDASLALPLPGAVVGCAGTLKNAEGADPFDWYAIDVAEDASLVARIDTGSSIDLCLYDPAGTLVDCDGEVAVEDPAPGTWRLRVSREGGWGWQETAYAISVATRDVRTTHRAVGTLLGVGPEPVPRMEGIDGSWIEITGPSVAYRVHDDDWTSYAMWHYDDAGNLLRRDEGRAADGWLAYEQWTAIPQGTVRMFLELGAGRSAGSTEVEARVYG